MVNITMRFKSVVLAVAMATSCSVSAEYVNPVTNVVSYLFENKKFVSALTIFVYAVKTRLETKAKCAYQLDQWRDDLQELLHSFNVFDPKLYKQLVYIFDKYFVGAQVKIEETATRTRNEDGSIFTIKGKKLIQRPFGLYGYFDAYVVGQMKKTTELVPVIMAFAFLIVDPIGAFKKPQSK